MFWACISGLFGLVTHLTSTCQSNTDGNPVSRSFHRELRFDAAGFSVGTGSRSAWLSASSWICMVSRQIQLQLLGLVGHVGLWWCTWIMIQIHSTIPSLHPGLGKCIRPWKVPWKSLWRKWSQNRPNAVAIGHLEGGMPWWDRVLQELLRDTSSDFTEVCVCVWMDFTEVSIVFHLRTFKPSKPDDKMLGLRAQAAHSTQLRSKCSVPLGNWSVLQLAFVVCLHVFFRSFHQCIKKLNLLFTDWTAEGAVFRCSSGVHAVRTNHLYTFSTP